LIPLAFAANGWYQSRMQPMNGTVPATLHDLDFQAAAAAARSCGCFGCGTTTEPARLNRKRGRDPFTSAV
jgi:hypothetical protein